MIRTIKYLIFKFFGNKTILTNENSQPMTSFHDLSFKAIDGKEIHFSQFKGKKVLLVNTASECGYTPQYDELEKLHQEHGKDIVVLGFPANNFGGQEPGSNEEIGAFCRKNFGVTFQLFEKSDVVGKSQNTVYQWLSDPEKNGWNSEKPNWNFCKYLVNGKGELVKFFTSAVSPLDAQITG